MDTKKSASTYCDNYFKRNRFVTREIMVGEVAMGGEKPVVIQSMTTSDTMNTQASIEESIRMIDAGCEVVRLTAPSKKDAKNLSFAGYIVTNIL